MKGLVKTTRGFGNLEIRDLDDPRAAPDHVVIEVEAAGICGSDVRHYQDGAGLRVPVVLGHEFSGTIVEVGRNVSSWEVGDRVTSETSAHTCGTCHYCLSGDYHLCPERRGLGSGVDGAFAKFVAVPTRLLHRIPDVIPFDEGAVIQPLADIVNAATRTTQILPGDAVAVLGPGPMGLLTTQVAKASGAGLVIQTGHRGVRLDIARKIGADVTIAVDEEDPVEKVRGLTNGLGADVVFEASGSPLAAVQAFDMVRRGGQITFIAAPTKPLEVDLRKILGKALVVKGSIMSKWVDYERAARLMSDGAVRVKPLITHKLPITEWKRAFDSILSEKTACKVLFTPV